jgi:hypothetical protein
MHGERIRHERHLRHQSALRLCASARPQHAFLLNALRFDDGDDEHLHGVDVAEGRSLTASFRAIAGGFESL